MANPQRQFMVKQDIFSNTIIGSRSVLFKLKIVVQI